MMSEPSHVDLSTPHGRWLPFVLALLFVVALLPVASSLLFYHSDERHYVESAQTMRQRGDWLTPATRREQIRLRKPIVTYWTVLVGQRALGINPLGLRIGFLLAGGAVIVLTATLARRAGCDERTALLAAIVMFGHVQLSMAATRATPDMVQCLFLLISAIGAAELLRAGPRRAAAWWLWIGAGLAVATKGLLAIVFVSYVIAWLVVARRRSGALRVACFPPAVIVGSALGIAWYVAGYIKHGDVLLNQFFFDQVAGPVTSRWWRVFYQVPMMLGAYFVVFLPWSLALLVTALRRERFAVPDDDQRRFTRFTLLWGVLLAVIFGAGTHLTFRYIFAASPLVAVAIASALMRADGVRRDRLLRQMGALLTCSLAVVVVLALVAHVQLKLWPYAIAVAAAFALMVACAVLQRRAGALAPALGLAMIVLLILPLVQAGTVWLRLPYPGRAVAQTLETLPQIDADRLVCVGDLRLPSRVLLQTGGRVFPDYIAPSKVSEADPQATLILDDPLRERVEASRYTWHVAGSRIENIDGPTAVMALLRGNIAALLEQHRQPIWFAVPK